MTNTKHLCAYGCNQPATHEFKSRPGVWCCATHPRRCPAILERAKATCQIKYGGNSPSHSSEVQAKQRATLHANYGVEYVLQSKILVDKTQQTNIERYGVRNPFQANSVKDKIKQRHLEKRGISHPSQSLEIKNRKRIKSLERYGCENPVQAEEVKLKARETYRREYGVDHPSQCPEIRQKTKRNGFRSKLYRLPSGAEVFVQGYEPFALDRLLARHAETDLLIDDDAKPAFWYEWQGKARRYFPDIIIPKEQLVVEVKSTYTYEIELARSRAKAHACLRQGYRFEFWVYDRKAKHFLVKNVSHVAD